MTLLDWAPVAEILGAMAVITSLVYLGIQIRELKNSSERDAAF